MKKITLFLDKSLTGALDEDMDEFSDLRTIANRAIQLIGKLCGNFLQFGVAGGGEEEGEPYPELGDIRRMWHPGNPDGEEFRAAMDKAHRIEVVIRQDFSGHPSVQLLITFLFYRRSEKQACYREEFIVTADSECHSGLTVGGGNNSGDPSSN